jgi:gluconokinase
MHFLCFDISSGGITSAVLDSELASTRLAENRWELEVDDRGAATLSAEIIDQHFRDAISRLGGLVDSINALCIGTFMHNFVLLDAVDNPLTPVFTWLDKRGNAGLEFVRSRFGDRFHQITGCRYHPMFPVFKLAALQLGDSQLWKQVKRVVSVKALLIHRLTGAWIEDHGLASAMGLFNVAECDWDAELLQLLNLDRLRLPAVGDRTDVAGEVTAGAASTYGLKPGIPVIVGSGDGFLANVGSDCEAPSKIAVTLGTSAVARQTLARPVLAGEAGTFCYRADRKDFLLGCAGSNGGNVLDWGRRILGSLEFDESVDPPIFLPLLHGERSPDWNPDLTGAWHHITARHTKADLARSIVEAVVFNLAHFVEILRETSAQSVTDLVVSGNGFLHAAAAPILATVTSISTWMPRTPGLASLRGAAICTARAMGESVPELACTLVPSYRDAKLLERYREYRRLRAVRC